MAEAYIHHYLNWRKGKIYRDGVLCFEHCIADSADVLSTAYKSLNLAYPKFYKMDLLSRLGFLSLEWLQPELDTAKPYETGIICSTHYGSLEVDKAFNHSRETFASPALFVYTLANIALGEICIRNKIKGPQVCLIEAETNAELLGEQAQNLLNRKRARNCIVGHLDARATTLFADMAWISVNEKSNNIPLTTENLAGLFGQNDCL